jgi:hypothetical protein
VAVSVTKAVSSWVMEASTSRVVVAATGVMVATTPVTVVTWSVMVLVT